MKSTRVTLPVRIGTDLESDFPSSFFQNATLSQCVFVIHTIISRKKSSDYIVNERFYEASVCDNATTKAPPAQLKKEL